MFNLGYKRVFEAGCLTLGLTSPIEAYPSTLAPTMAGQFERVQRAEALGFRAIWVRDVPFNVPSFGDAGQMHDPWAYLGYLAAKTETMALVTGSVILPLRHPAFVAKSAASIDVLSGWRLILGVASGDRPQEYAALGKDLQARGQAFRDALAYIRQAWGDFPEIDNPHGQASGMDLLPKPTAGQIPILITGGSSQPMDWVSEHADGWITYPRNVGGQAQAVRDFQRGTDKPVAQSLYIDLCDEGENASPIHLGFRAPPSFLIKYLKSIEEIGVGHVALNLRFNQADIDTTLERLAAEVLPHFHGDLNGDPT